jgi:adenosylhomocysteine nucleosidase
MRVVVLVSADGEWQAVKSLLHGLEAQSTTLGESFEASLEGRPLIFLRGGWGRVAAAASTQYAIDHLQPELLVNLGTCGGFQGRIEQGIIILVERTVIYDIIEQMTDPEEAIEHYTTKLDLGWLPRLTPSPVSRGLLVSGDRDILPADIPGLIQKYDAVAADWESGAIAWVAQKNHQRLLILRGVSDLVGREGGEVYGDYELFQSRTREIMRHLLDVLPKWLSAIEKVQQGYHV